MRTRHLIKTFELINFVPLSMTEKKISPEPAMLITRIHDVVVVEYTCDQEDNYKCSEYAFIDAEDKAKRFEQDLKWVAHIVNGSNFSFYTNEEEVIIDHSNLTSISIATGFTGCEFMQY